MKVEKIPVTIEDKLNKINYVYSECFSEEPYLFNKLRDNGNEKMKNHVLFDVIDIMLSTWCSIGEASKKIGQKVNKGEYFIFIYGLLQVMYVHQDLMDELLWICKVSNEESAEKRTLIRKIRNHSVGHPINTNFNENPKLMSTVVWCWDDIYKEEGIQHVEYFYRKEGLIIEEKDNEGNEHGGQELRKLKIKKLIQDHTDYINFCLDQVLKVFRKYLKKHLKLQESILKILNKEPTKEQYKLAVKLIDDKDIGTCKLLNRQSGYYSYNNLISAIDKMDQAPRYKSFVEDYFIKIVDCLKTGKDNIYKSSYEEIIELLSGTKKKTIDDYGDLPNIKIVIKKSSEDRELLEQKKTIKDKTMYYISKFFEKKHYNDLDVMRKILKDYPDMIVEINHMDKHWVDNDERVDKENEMEYFTALIYLKKMIKEKT